MEIFIVAFSVLLHLSLWFCPTLMTRLIMFIGTAGPCMAAFYAW